MITRMFAILLLVPTLLLGKDAPSAVRKLTVPPLTYKHRALPNGLEVYTVQDRSTPTVAIQVWYRVGSKDDPAGRSGFAHLFEHMMFKSTKNMQSEMMDRLTEDVGGWNNATTTDDATPYYEVVPSNYLETLLWAEAERMGSLNVDDANFKSERDVVKEEFRYRILAPPYGRFFYAITKNAFTTHPYRRPGIGSIEELDAASLEDVRKFHDTYYRPDNAVLLVVGDFDQTQADAWIDKYLSPIPKPAAAIPRVEIAEPERKTEQRVVAKAPNVPLPGVALTWLAPDAASKDADALSVAAAILSKGESSRLFRSLIYKSKIAQEIDAGADLREDLGLFYVLAIMSSDHGVEEGEKALRKELAALEQTLVTPAELSKAKNLLITDELRGRETNSGKAFALGEAIVLEHDAAQVNRAVARLQAVTADDIRRVIRKYVRDAKPAVVTYVAEPEPKKESGE